MRRESSRKLCPVHTPPNPKYRQVTITRPKPIMARPGLLLLLALFCLLAAASVEAFLGPTPCPQQPLQQQHRMWQQQPQQLQELRRREALPLVSRPQQRPASLATHGT